MNGIHSFFFYPNYMGIFYIYPMVSIGNHFFGCVYIEYAFHEGILILRK